MSDTPHTNGHAPRVDFRRQYQRSETRRLLERYSRWDDDWSCADLYRETRTSYFDVPGSQPSDRAKGEEWPIWRTIEEVNRLRQKGRIVCATNPYARGLLTNLITHIVGKGFKYKFLSKEDTADSDPDKAGRAAAIKQLVAKAQDEWDRFQRRTHWSGMSGPHTRPGPTREQECLRRVLRDGEVFLHYVPVEGRLTVRFIEPERVYGQPDAATPADGWNLGIQCDLEDPEAVQAYCVAWTDPVVMSLTGEKDYRWGEVIDAADIDHLKGPDTDSTIRRGISAFAFGVAAALERARVLGRNVSIGAQVKAAIAETWEHETGTETEVSTFSSAQADHTETYTKGDGSTGTRDVDVRDPGTVRRVPKGMTSVYPGPDNAAIYLQVLQADLRAACAAFAAPEYFTADASNGTYAGMKEASAPFVKFAESYQIYLGAAFARVVWRVIELAVNEGRLPREALTLLDLQVEGPTVYQRDRLQVAQESQIYNMLGVWSPQTIAMETGKDYEVEAANIEAHRERFGDMGTPLGMPGADGALPGMPPLGQGLGDDAGGALHESTLEAAGTCKQGEESACPSCGPDCDCEHCRAKTPLLETEGVLDVPDSRQSESWSCGAAVVTSIAQFFGVEPNTEPEAVLALGSSPRDGTDPEHLVSVLQGAGLETTALAGMDLEQLEWFLSKGRPVICAIQAWGDVPIQEAAGTCGVGQNPERDGCVKASGDATETPKAGDAPTPLEGRAAVKMLEKERLELTPDQEMAVRKYTMHQSMNPLISERPKAVVDQAKAVVDEKQVEFSSPVLAYRGMNLADGGASFKVGQEISLDKDGLASLSVSKDVAETFSKKGDGKPVMFSVVARKGFYVGMLSAYRERELLMSKTTFRVIGKKPGEIQLEQING